MANTRITVIVDDGLIVQAQACTGLTGKSVIVREALKALNQRESAWNLARLGGSQPDLRPVQRRRPDSISLGQTRSIRAILPKPA